MHVIRNWRQVPHVIIGRLGALGMGLVLAAAALTPGTTLAVPQAKCANVQCIIQVGDTMVANRITALNTLAGKVQDQQNKGHLTAGQASKVQANISTNISGLNTLKADLDGQPNTAAGMTAARQDVRDIVLNFRIYVLVLPRDTNQVLLDMEMNVDARLKAVQPKIEAAIEAVRGLPDKDNDKEKIASAYADYKNQLAAAEGQIDSAQGLMPTLTLSAVNNSLATYKTDLTDCRSDLRVGHTNLRQAAKDLHIIAQALKDLVGDQAGRNPAAPAPSASPTTISQ